MSHVKHLRVETEEELEALTWVLAYAAASAHVDARRSRLAAQLHDRLSVTPTARNGGIVHVEDAAYAPSASDNRRGHSAAATDE